MATLPGYLCIGGNEIVNHCRTMAYVNAGLAPAWSAGVTSSCECCCETVDDGNYTTPSDVEGNPAPWYDPNRPESAEFYGILVSDMHMSTPLTASLVDSSIGRSCPIPVPRVITLEGAIVASSARGTAYGREWLVRALASPCVGGCCPSRDGEVLLWCEPEIGSV